MRDNCLEGSSGEHNILFIILNFNKTCEIANNQI